MSVIYDDISTRDAFGIALLDMARADESIIAIGADTTKSMGFKPMMAEFPERVINNGIAEQNMALMAAGIASCGGKAVVATYAPFASMRIAEQVRTFLGYPKLDVKVISGLSGLSGNVEGVTHQGLEDISIMRSMANLTVAVPADAASCIEVAKKIIGFSGPAYLRLGRGASENVYDSSFRFEIGRANLLSADGTDVAVICCGAAVARALRAKPVWEAAGIKARVIDMASIKPLDEQAVLDAAANCGYIVTVEENNILGGLGGAVCEAVCAKAPCRVLRVGIEDRYAESAPHDELLDKYGLDPRHIAEVVIAGKNGG